MTKPEKQAKKFHVVLIKPSHYDDEGYVIQWFRSTVPSNTLAVLYGLSKDMADRRILGDDVNIVLSAFDETNTRIPVKQIIRQIQSSGGAGLVGFVGVQSNQFPRTMDIARHFREAGIQVCIGGFHISGCLAMLPEIPNDIQQALDLGISLFAGEAEGQRFDAVLKDAHSKQLKPIYNYLDALPDIASAPTPFLPSDIVRRTINSYTSFDAGRGCPFQCSFCTIINVQGRKSRRRSADDVEAIVRKNAAQGVTRYFITDDNFARNRDWEEIFDRLIQLREKEGINIRLILQVDTMCHRIPRFIEKAGRAGTTQVFIGLENINPDNLKAAGKKQNKITEYRKMVQYWRDDGVITTAGYILGFPADTPEKIARDVETIKQELPIDFLEFFNLTPLPGSQDHKALHEQGTWMEPDMNNYDLSHVTREHPAMSRQEWSEAFQQAWLNFYSAEYMKTLIKRAYVSGIGVSKVSFMLWWFQYCFKYEGLNPLDGGYFRQKYRLDRRPGMPIENPLTFYPRRIWEVLRSHVMLASLALKYSYILRKIKKDPNSRHYSDNALVPVQEPAEQILD